MNRLLQACMRVHASLHAHLALAVAKEKKRRRNNLNLLLPKDHLLNCYFALSKKTSKFFFKKKVVTACLSWLPVCKSLYLLSTVCLYILSACLSPSLRVTDLMRKIPLPTRAPFCSWFLFSPSSSSLYYYHNRSLSV